MINKKNSICVFCTLILVLWIAVVPVAATLEPAFSWQVYRINTDDWAYYNDYASYTGTIYKVQYTDKTEGNPKSWKWEFSDDDWYGSTEQNPVYIYTEDEAEDSEYRFQVTLTAMDNSGNYEEVTNYVYVIEDAWNPYKIIDLTPVPTATPTTRPTTAPPTTVVTTIPTTPTPEPTPVPSFSLNIPVISDELTKLKTAYNDHLEIIMQIFRNIGILKN
jgi:PKD repeat protein